MEGGSILLLILEETICLGNFFPRGKITPGPFFRRESICCNRGLFSIKYNTYHSVLCSILHILNSCLIGNVYLLNIFFFKLMYNYYFIFEIFTTIICMQSMYICVDQKSWSSFNNIVRYCSNFPSDSGKEETNKNVDRKIKGNTY